MNSDIASLTPYDYIRLCYRGATAYADGMPEHLLRSFHIKTNLDREIKRAVKRGLSVVLTGNPGDGKTHLLRILEKDIKKANPKAVIEYDASEKTNEDVILTWKAAVRKKAPFCVAVNEAVLKQLADDNPSFDHVVRAQSQVEEAITYHRGDDRPPRANDDKLVVFDLSRRNSLSEDIIGAVIKTFINKERPVVCDNQLNDFCLHASLISDDLFKRRLQVLLERIARRGFHCTLRELQGFISFLLCRGLDCDSLAQESGKTDNFIAELVFAGKGALFDAIRGGFDPRNVCHPLWDVRLISAELEHETWNPEATSIVNAIDVDDVSEAERR